jgi:hypothetical protein
MSFRSSVVERAFPWPRDEAEGSPPLVGEAPAEPRTFTRATWHALKLGALAPGPPSRSHSLPPSNVSNFITFLVRVRQHGRLTDSTELAQAPPNNLIVNQPEWPWHSYRLVKTKSAAVTTAADSCLVNFDYWSIALLIFFDLPLRLCVSFFVFISSLG